jgi:hypothetical protein
MEGQSLQDAVEFLVETPATVRRLAAGLTGEELRWKESGDKFSFVEQACHLRDIEREGYQLRIKKLLTESEPRLEDIDGLKLASERRYHEQDFEAALESFAGARRENVETVRDLSVEQLGRSGAFEGVGAVSLEKLIAMMCEHDRDHREELGVLRERLAKRRTDGL